jgi:lysophospholipase L1-like esterase
MSEWGWRPAAGPVRAVPICARVTFACPPCVLRQAQDALSLPKGAQMGSAPATHGRGIRIAVVISLLLAAFLVLAPAVRTAGVGKTAGVETRSPAGIGPQHAGFETAPSWVGTWMSAQQLVEQGNLPPAPGVADATLRQIVHVSIGGRTLRVRFSNEFGSAPLTLEAARIARASGGSAIDTATDRALTFGGRPAAVISEGAALLTDPLDFDLPPLSNLAVTIYVRGAPPHVTGHPGSRTTSYLHAGHAASAPALPDAVPVDHWYFLSGIEVRATRTAGAVIILGDSITDGRGSTTNGNDRWPDVLARRLQAAPATAEVAVLNAGIGGNRLLRDGLGPNALARLDRDVLAQPGVRWLVVFEGINDIGTAAGAREKGEPAATADDIIGAYAQIIERARAQGIRVSGCTIMPFEGFTYAGYYTPAGEADRQRINNWIRTSGRFDAVIDFDAITRDPERPSRLAPAVDGGDHLHPSAAGYKVLADAIDLALFAPPAR